MDSIEGFRFVAPGPYRQCVRGDRVAANQVVGVPQGSWRRGSERITLVRTGTQWAVHRTGAPPVTYPNQTLAFAAIATATRDCPACGEPVGSWTFYPPPRRYRGTVAR